MLLIALAPVVRSGLALAAETGDEYITDQGGGVYEVNATSGLSLADFSDTWTNAFLKSTDTFVFKGADGKGMNFDYKDSPLVGTTFTNQFSHLVFDGGEQAYGWMPSGPTSTKANSNPFNASTRRLAAGSARENPAIKVKSGTKLTFFARSYCGGDHSSVDNGAWMEVEDGATLSITNDIAYASESNESALIFPTVLQPGATCEISFPCYGNKQNLGWRSYFANDTLFYVPATTNGDPRVATIRIKQSYVYLGGTATATKHFGVNVGENANLLMTGGIMGNYNNCYFAIGKYGAGLLNWNVNPNSTVRHQVFRVHEGTVVYNSTGFSSYVRPEVDLGATFEFVSGCAAKAVNGLLNKGTFRVTGSKAVTLLNCQMLGTIEVPDGATLNYQRTVTKTDNRVAWIGEPIDSLTLIDSANSSVTYPIVGHDDDYVYFNYVETLTNGVNAITGVHSLHAVNEDPETETNITATASSFDIEGRMATLEVDANVTLTVDAPVCGTVAKLSGAGDLVLVNPSSVVIYDVSEFTGNLTISGGAAVLPKALEGSGRVTVENGAVVSYQSLSAFVSRSATLTVTGYDGESALTNFPVLVRLSPASVPGFDYGDLESDGSDLFFADETAETLFPHEIEVWNPQGESLVWVRIPVLANGTKFKLLCGGNRFPSTATETWKRSGAEGAGDYGAVWHMAEASGTVADATGNGLTATPYKNNTTAGYANSTNRAGVVGMARHISDSAIQSGPKLRVDRTAFNALNTIGKFSFSTWVRPDDAAALTSSYPRFFSCKSKNSDTTGFAVQITKGSSKGIFFGTYVSGSDQGKTEFMADDSWAVDTWGFYTFVVDGLSLSIYENGTNVCKATLTNALVNPASADLFLGGAYGEWSLAGSLDETRILCDAASADWVKADYDTQTKADFLTASSVETNSLTTCDVLLKTVTSDSIRLTAEISGEDDAVHTVTAAIYDADDVLVTNVSRTVTCPLATPVELYVDGLASGSNYTVRVTMADSANGLWSRAIATQQKVVLMTGDYYQKSSFSTDTVDGTPMCTHSNNWSNTVTGEILSFPQAGTDLDYVVDATKGADPTSGGSWALRTKDSVGGTSTHFYGPRLTIVGDYQTNTLRCTNGGSLLNMQNWWEYRTWTYINELVLKNGALFIHNSSPWTSLDTQIVIPYGYAGYFMGVRDSSANTRFHHFNGSMVGEGDAVFSLCGLSGVSRGFDFASDLSDFTGKVWFNKIRTVRFRAESTPFADTPEAVRDGITLDNRYYTATETLRSGDNGASRLFFDADTTWATPNRGITFADSEVTTNLWEIAITNGATVTMENPLYGAAADKGAAYSRFGLNGELDGYQTGTLVLKASEGDWAGTFALTNGTLVLAGTKPLADATLDAGGAAVVRIPSGAKPYLGNATKTTKITIETPENPDYNAGVEILRTSAACQLSSQNFIVESGARSDIVVRSRIVGDVRVYSLCLKSGFMVIIR